MSEVNKDVVNPTLEFPSPRKRPAVDSLDADLSLGLSELIQLAKDAFEQKRRKQCLALTRAILKIEADNREALLLHSLVRSGLEKDLEGAHTLISEARRQSDGTLYERAETSLRAILDVDPKDVVARALLFDVFAGQSQSHTDGTTPLPPPGFPDAQLSLGFPKPDRRPMDFVRSIVGTARSLTSSRLLRLGVVIATILLVVIGVGYAAFTEIRKNQSVSTQAFDSVRSAAIQENARTVLPLSVPENVNTPVAAESGNQRAKADEPSGASLASAPLAKAKLPLAKASVPLAKEATLPRVTPTLKAVPSQTAAPVVIATAPGTLAVSAPMPVEIYRGEEHLGTTPITLELQSGVQTLEYRYGTLRKTLSHTIKSNETTTASVSFDVTVQINARPWAQVSVEGIQTRVLGQTPMSNVHVPAGSTLVFQNPNFAEKKVRVSGTESVIQVVFP